MDLNYSPEEQAFRGEVQAFLRDHLPEDVAQANKSGKRLTKDQMERWHKALNHQGWHARTWPQEYGGAAFSPVQEHIFDEEAAAVGAPRTVPFGINMLGPVLHKFGNQRQKDYYLPRILDCTDWWCQGYSEPGSGSDLASLKTKAVREGDYYIVNGQKTWTTLGQYADKIFCLVRTSNEGKPQQGISFLLIDMDTPGVEVRPIILMEKTHEVNEVWFSDVKVPVENLVGEENQGWTIAKYLLTHERTNISGVGMSKAALSHLKFIAQDQQKNGRPLMEDSRFRSEIAEVEMDLEAMAITDLRAISQISEGGDASTLSSMLKIKGTMIRMRINELTRKALGPYAMPFVSEALDDGYNEPPIGPEYAAPVAATYFNNRKMPIYGGSNEIQRNIISKIMGM